MLIAVLPPIAASTMARSVVGMKMTGMPRSQVAATNPARSVTAPPPTPMIRSDRDARSSASRPDRCCDSDVLGSLSRWYGYRVHGVSRASQRRAGGRGQVIQALGVDERDRARPVAGHSRQLRGDPVAKEHLVGPLAADGDARDAHRPHRAPSAARAIMPG